MDFFQIKYSQFLKAFISKQEQNSSIHFWKVGSCDYVYDIDMVRHKLIKYFAGENLYVEQKGYFDQNFSFGINVYDNIEKYYQFDHEEINISIPSKLLEHKVWLEEVIFYYFNKINKVMDDELKVLLKKLILEARLLKNYSIKYNFEFHLDRRQIIISKCIQKMKLLKDLEERASILIL
ncbi:hypothetical protein FACS1894193_01040 [Bacilli bacterium]|nr:hypothetical protein FACS1894193_01040 [Bacilli bacterium]